MSVSQCALIWTPCWRVEANPDVTVPLCAGHSGVACLERQEKFKMLSKNRPLQMVLIVEEGEEARMSCHFWFVVWMCV